MNEAIFWLSVHMNPATSQNIEAPYEKFCSVLVAILKSVF